MSRLHECTMYECTVRKRRVRAVLTGSESSAFPSAKLGTRYPPLCRLLRNRCTAAISADNAILDRHDDTGMAVLCFVNGRGRARARADRRQSVSQSVISRSRPPQPISKSPHGTVRYVRLCAVRPSGLSPARTLHIPFQLASRHVRRFKNTVGEPGRSTVTTGTAEG